jgi:RNA polymerase-binding transcription factor DksA
MSLTITQLVQLRKIIFTQLLACLRKDDHFSPELESAIQESSSTKQLERFLVFQGDPWLYELSTALKRIEEGKYGICMLCKEGISLEELQLHPVARICRRCAFELGLDKFNL